MHLELPHLVYSGPPADDADMLVRVPPPLAAMLRERNGVVGFGGGLHVRGACREPAWHSLRHAWEGADALHQLFEEVRPGDLPLAEDAFGDQFLLREGKVLRLSGELGEMAPAADGLEEFFGRVLADPGRMLDYAPLLAFLAGGGELRPGQLLAAYPPFVLSAEGARRDIRAVDALERRRALADLARRLHGLPEGTEVRFEVTD
jgi:hypothetical protein